MLTNASRGEGATEGRGSIVRRGVTLVLVLGLTLLAGISGCSVMRFENGPSTYGSVDYDPAKGFLLPRGPWERYEGLFDEAGLQGRQPSYVMATLRSGVLVLKEDRSTDRTYRLRIVVEGPETERAWILVLPTAFPPAKISVDGKDLVARNHTLTFSSSGKELSLLVQVPAGAAGLDSTRLSPGLLLFGESGPVLQFLVVVGGTSFMIIGAFALAGLFLLFLFNLWTKNHEFLAFAVLLLAEAFRYYVNAAALLPFAPVLEFSPDVRHAIAFDIQFAALIVFFAVLLKKRGRLVGWLFFLPLLGLAVAEVYFRDQVYLLHFVTLGYYAICCLAAFVTLLVKGIKGSTLSAWLAVAPLCLLAALPLRLLDADSPTVAFFIEPMTTVLFALVVANALLMKIGKSFRTTETLTTYVSDVSDTVKRFIPQEFLDALDKRDVIDLRLGDHVKKDMTIFFSDIRAFTELSEKLTVEENFAFINSYLSRVVPIIKENGGFVDKYIGDAIMALYPGPDGPDQALRTAIEMQSKMTEYNMHRAKVGYRPISMGVGLHTGSLMLGVVGVDDRMENTVISDSVNLASRLQAITKAFNISLAVSEQVFKAIRDPGAYTFRFIGKVKVKGKADPVSVFEIFDGVEPSLFERKMKANTFFEQGMLSYYQKDFSGAMYYFKRVLDSLPEDGAASFYLETCMNRASL